MLRVCAGALLALLLAGCGQPAATGTTETAGESPAVVGETGSAPVVIPAGAESVVLKVPGMT